MVGRLLLTVVVDDVEVDELRKNKIEQSIPRQQP
jgi:hypothetical protein